MKRDAGIIGVIACIIVLALIAAAGCAGVQPAAERGSGQTDLVVFAAASLTGAMTGIAREYEAVHPDTRIVLNFDGSQALRSQIEQGARADLFLSANTRHMTALQGEGLMVNDSVTVFAKNRLALIVPKENRANITGLADLARPDIRLVIGTKDVPFGDYTRQALGKMAGDSACGPEYTNAVMENVVSEDPTVTALVAKIRLGEADAGIAYASDVSGGDRALVTAIPIPDRYNVIAEYPLGVVRDAKEKDRAIAFARFIMSDEGNAILKRYGFTPSGN